MNRNIFPVTEPEVIKGKVLNWLKQFNTFCFLDGREWMSGPSGLQWLAGAGSRVECRIGALNGPEYPGHSSSVRNASVAPATQSEHPFDQLQRFLDSVKGEWCLGHLNFEFGRSVDPSHTDHIGFPAAYFFVPDVLLKMEAGSLTIECDHRAPATIWEEILLVNEAMLRVTGGSLRSATPGDAPSAPVFRSRLTRQEYLERVEQLRHHIHRGDCYEINFCQDYFAEGVGIDPTDVFRSLTGISSGPFSALYRLDDSWLICASPERYIRKKGNQVWSQPIKGTAPRYPDDAQRDLQSREALRNSAKDRAENVMIVDLVRNDLSRFCREGSVQVEELFGIYSFPQVHQMISTITGQVDPQIPFSDMLKASYPMGSMTGAPKQRVTELISQYEPTLRGLYSGSVGYVDPTGDLDFNVVIRSILYNHSTGHASFPAGSAITFSSDAIAEWEECELKARAMKETLRKFNS